jgi:hypothetical protein
MKAFKKVFKPKWTFSSWLLGKLQNWLGITATNYRLDWADDYQKETRRMLNDQMTMIGLDVGLKHDQTIIIFVSRLGREGGTVQIKPAYFKSVGELMDFIKFVDRSFGPDRIAIDVPYGMGRLIDEERKRR